MISNCFLKDELKAFFIHKELSSGPYTFPIELTMSLIKSCIFYLPMKVYYCSGKQITKCSNWQVSRSDNML